MSKFINYIFVLVLVSGMEINPGYAQHFQQSSINNALSNYEPALPELQPVNGTGNEFDMKTGVHQFMKSLPRWMEIINDGSSVSNATNAVDTIFVGDIPNDTFLVSGTFFNNGPILVFNDGVLLFENANATLLGDIYVFQDGKMIADSSTITSPQQYFYQRGIIIANNGYVSISNCTLDYSGLSHNLAVVDNGAIELNNIINIGFTTAGAYGNGSIIINGSNQAGEFIMTDSASFSFTDANTVLLWHHLDDGSLVNLTFPSGANVPSYLFNDALPNVSGVGYDVEVVNCTDVMWALMPENGSDITIDNSTLRAIGLWFTGNDTSAVSGLVNNSNYTVFTAPLSDRNLQLNSTSVQTWSLYMFNSTVVNVTGCIVGEVGSMGTSFVNAQGILCDGSGGYYWSNDTSLNIAVNTTILGYIRSQGNGIVLLGYGSSTSGASAIGNSVMVVTQSSLPQDPVAFENGTAWRVHIDPPQNLFVDTVVNINGSAWIDQGPLGSFMDFGFYKVEYRPASGSTWLPVSVANTNEVHSNLLAQWDTHGLTPGAYQIRVNTENNLGDSIDAVIQVTLLPSIVGIESVDQDQNSLDAYYNSSTRHIICNAILDKNCFGEVEIKDVNGKIILTKTETFNQGENHLNLAAESMSPGIYFITLRSHDLYLVKKLLVFSDNDKK